MNPDDLRRGFLKFFADRGHEIVPSDGLVPENDPSLLFTPAGMNQFKDMFLGMGTRSYVRAASSQKCLRMPDLDNVGRTASHHTFFEMLGNFSFGDYFKKEAIAWAIEYLVEDLGIPFEDLAFTIYKDDDEAAKIWLEGMNVPSGRLYRYGEKSNFWPAEAPSKGPNGVCGPCSEIHVDLGGGCGRPDCNPECGCGRFVEVWNLVFTQFFRKDGGILEPLPRKNIDTGMGFERLLRVLEGVPSNFDTTLFKPIVSAISKRAKKEYGADFGEDVRIRRIADHVRAAVFCIAEGIRPANIKQGYVVRKILRRAVLDGNKLGIEGLFLSGLVQPVAEVMGKAYPEVAENRERIEREIRAEEEKFTATFLQGLNRLEGFVHDLEKRGSKVLPGKEAFLLYDTFGFPLDITVRYLEETGGAVDIEGFNREMEAQRARARAGSNIAEEVFDTGPVARLKGLVEDTHFTGYEETSCRCRIEAILTDEGLVDSAPQGTPASLILDKTPFYAEAGGQVGDRGLIRSETFSFSVNANTVKESGYYLHKGCVTEGTVIKGDPALAAVDIERRKAIQRNHTATHLLQWALRRVLGPHVEQAGSSVDDRRLRFDFHHPKALTREEIERVQRAVNEKIRADLPVETAIQPIEKAKAMGAIALFGEKYGKEVRTVTIAGFDRSESSIELCGGTHVSRTGEIGGFAILGEESIAAGVRRIEAATAAALEEHMNREHALLVEASRMLKIPTQKLGEAIDDLLGQVKKLRKEAARFREEKAAERLASILASGKDLGGGFKFYMGRIDGLGPPELKKLIDKVRGRSPHSFGIVLVSKDGERANFVAAVDEALLEKGVSPADAICRDLGRRTDGGGGGRPNMAQGQGRAPEDLDGLLEEIVSKSLPAREK